MLTGCLIDDPPPFAQPKRTPPRLEYHRARPPLDQVIVASTPDQLKFSIPVASEDAGEGLVSLLYVDEQFTNFKALPPSTLDDPRERLVLFTYTVPKLQGVCHKFKIRVGHASNLPDGDSAPLDSDDLAEAYWLAYLNLPSDQSGAPDCAYLGEDPAP
ncbi:MAG: hypothetical protein EOO73_16375 [Myxococcales bacterium]|nr:MAG: hypothetical protein EOO73_16375 [Myxococcales bacterium]